MHVHAILSARASREGYDSSPSVGTNREIKIIFGTIGARMDLALLNRRPWDPVNVYEIFRSNLEPRSHPV